MKGELAKVARQRHGAKFLVNYLFIRVYYMLIALCQSEVGSASKNG